MIDSLTQNAKIQRKCLKMWDNRSFSARKLFLNQKLLPCQNSFFRKFCYSFAVKHKFDCAMRANRHTPVIVKLLLFPVYLIWFILEQAMEVRA